jgi:hypothetical protein
MNGCHRTAALCGLWCVTHRRVDSSGRYRPEEHLRYPGLPSPLIPPPRFKSRRDCHSAKCLTCSTYLLVTPKRPGRHSCFPSAPALLRYGLEEPTCCAPKRCHVENTPALEAQSQPQAAYRIAFDPSTLHAIRISVRVVGDEPLLHARLAFRAITAAIRHSTLPFLNRTCRRKEGLRR